jgi:hypothetical protein
VTFGQLLNRRLERHQGGAETLDLFRCQRPLAHAPHSLAFEQLADELDECQHEPDH